MTTLNPNWENLKDDAYSAYIPDEVLMYRSDEIYAIRDWAKEHPIRKPVEIEIGSNRGRFILGLARARRQTHFVGIEMKSSLVRLSNNKLTREGLDNACVINADARLALPLLFERESVDAVYVLFPDPWWKKRHARRRLLDESFFDMLHDFLSPNAVFVLKTDVHDYFKHVRSLLEASPRYQVIDNQEIPHQDSWELTTRERHCVADNTPYEMLAARKI